MKTVVQHALTRNGMCWFIIKLVQLHVWSYWWRSGIPTVRIDSGNRKQDAATKFRNDPNILVLILHGCVHIRRMPNEGRGC